LSDAVAAELVRVIETLHRIYPSGGETELDAFRTAFRERFEDREVPLVVALDEELGVGFGAVAGPSADGAPLLADLEPAADAERPGKWERRDSHLLSLLLDARAAGGNEIRLTEADLAILANPSPPPLPDAVGVAASVAAASHEAAANGDFRLLFSKASGPSGVNMLGRFCHLDPAIEAIVRRNVAAEEAFAPDATYAEIVHLPEGRVGNIIARPVLRGAEIAFLGRSGADEQIPLTDLLVSIHDGGIRLRSARTGRRVVPRLTNAHYYQRGAMAAYRFLASLQYDRQAASLSWRWGPLTNAKSLPRVVLGRTVLERACWAVGPRELEAVLKAATPAATFRAVQALRERRGLPGRLVVAVSDNELTVDLDTAAGCELLAHEARRGSGLRLVERFPDFDDLCVENPEGAFFHEIVVPFVKPAPPPVATTAPRRVVAAPAPDGFAASFPPGSEWLSTKLYCGQASTDAVIRGVVAPVAATALREGACDGWFFLRYRDPQPHVRFRLHGPADRVAGDVLPLLRRVAAPFADSGLVWRTEVDTYTREVDRYGGPAGVLLAEQVFRADSEAALAVLLRAPDGADGAAALGDRWRLALVAADRLFADLGFDVAARQTLARLQRDGLAAEFRGAGENARRLAGRLMRKERAGLDALLDGAAPAPGLVAGVAALDRRSAAFAAPFARLRALDAAGALTQPLAAVALSYNHIAMIRLLRGAARLQELVIYDLLDRLYSARLGRAAGAR
jgi:thiopeptide-type bacteriocin biosynthesis protein